MNTILSRMWQVYRVLRKTFGVYVTPIFVALGFGLLRLVVGIGMALDHIFFPSLRKTKASRPIVIVGNPRTGTTFLQRLLSDEGFGAGMELFLMLYPSLTIQKLLKPFLPLLEKLKRTRRRRPPPGQSLTARRRSTRPGTASGCPCMGRWRWRMTPLG